MCISGLTGYSPSMHGSPIVHRWSAGARLRKFGVSAPDYADHLALDQDVGKWVAHDREGNVFRAQFDMIGAQEKAFDCGLVAVEQDGDDLAVFGVLPGFADHQVAVEDTGTAHGLAADPQTEEVVAGKQVGVDYHRLVPFLLGIHGQAGGDPADDGQCPACCGSGDFILFRQQTNGSAVMTAPFQQPFFFQLTQYLGHGGMADPQITGSPAQAGCPAVFFEPLFQIVEKAVLLIGKFHIFFPLARISHELRNPGQAFIYICCTFIYIMPIFDKCQYTFMTDGIVLWLFRMKCFLVKLKGITRRRASLPAATLRPYRRYTTADRQAVPGLLSIADVLSATLRA